MLSFLYCKLVFPKTFLHAYHFLLLYSVRVPPTLHLAGTVLPNLYLTVAQFFQYSAICFLYQFSAYFQKKKSSHQTPHLFARFVTTVFASRTMKVLKVEFLCKFLRKLKLQVHHPKDPRVPQFGNHWSMTNKNFEKFALQRKNKWCLAMPIFLRKCSSVARKGGGGGGYSSQPYSPTNQNAEQ